VGDSGFSPHQAWQSSEQCQSCLWAGDNKQVTCDTPWATLPLPEKQFNY